MNKPLKLAVDADDQFRSDVAMKGQSDKVKRFLEQQSFVDTNADETLTDEEKASSINYDDLNEEEKQELNEILQSQIDSSSKPIKFQYLKAPRKALNQKQLTVRKKKKRTSNASRKVNQKKAKKR